MKKITLLTILLTVSFGYAQNSPITFDVDVTVGGNWNNVTGIATSLVDVSDASIPGAVNAPASPAGMVGKMVTDAGANPWQEAHLIMTTAAVDLTQVNKKIVIDVYSTTGNDFLLKVVNPVGGGTAFSQVPAAHDGTGWEQLEFDFDNATDGGVPNAEFENLVFFPLYDAVAVDFIPAAMTTTAIDNVVFIEGSAIVPPPPLPSPAPQPTTPDAKTFSINSDTGGYTSGFDYGGGCFGVLAGEPDLDTGAGVNKALEFDFGVAGWGCTNSANVDVSTIGGDPIAFASFQYYTDDATDFFFDLISNTAGTTESFYYVGQSSAGGAPAADIVIVQGSWQHVIIPISEFTSQTFDPTNLFQFKFDVFAGLTPGTIYVDNVLLSSVSPTLGVETAELAQFNVYPNPSQSVWNVKTNNQTLNSIQVFDILGKQVLTLNPKANNAVIDATNLSNGLYFAKVNTDKGSSTLKLIKN